jgi:putative transposase
MMNHYAKNPGAVVSLKYHVVFCPKYRRFVLGRLVDQRLKEVPAETAAHGMTFHAVEVMPDHVRLFVEADPTVCVAEIVNRLKGRTSRVLLEAFPSLCSPLPTL